MKYHQTLVALLFALFFLVIPCHPMHPGYGPEEQAASLHSTITSISIPAEFTEIKISDISLVTIVQVSTKKEEGLLIQTAETRTPFIMTGINDTTLHLWKTFESPHPVHCVLKVKSFNALTVAGNGRVKLGIAAAIQLAKLTITISDSGQMCSRSLMVDTELCLNICNQGVVTIQGLNCPLLKAVISGSGKVTLKGAVKKQHIVAHENAQIDHQELSGKKCSITLQKPATAHLNIKRIVSAQAEDNEDNLINHGPGNVVFNDYRGLCYDRNRVQQSTPKKP